MFGKPRQSALPPAPAKVPSAADQLKTQETSAMDASIDTMRQQAKRRGRSSTFLAQSMSPESSLGVTKLTGV